VKKQKVCYFFNSSGTHGHNCYHR